MGLGGEDCEQGGWADTESGPTQVAPWSGCQGVWVAVKGRPGRHPIMAGPGIRFGRTRNRSGEGDGQRAWEMCVRCPGQSA
jgi:hypothetical protein